MQADEHHRHDLSTICTIRHAVSTMSRVDDGDERDHVDDDDEPTEELQELIQDLRRALLRSSDSSFDTLFSTKLRVERSLRCA